MSGRCMLCGRIVLLIGRIALRFKSEGKTEQQRVQISWQYRRCLSHAPSGALCAVDVRNCSSFVRETFGRWGTTYSDFSQCRISTFNLRQLSSACQPRSTGSKSATPISGHNRGMKWMAVFFVVCQSRKSLILHTPEVRMRMSGSGRCQPRSEFGEVYMPFSRVCEVICLIRVSVELADSFRTHDGESSPESHWSIAF